MDTREEQLSRIIRASDIVARELITNPEVIRSQEFRDFVVLQERLAIRVLGKEEVTETHLQNFENAAEVVVAANHHP